MTRSNYPVNKSVLNVIHARDFFTANDAASFAAVGTGLLEKYKPMEYGYQLPNFNMTHPEMDLILGAMLGDMVRIIDKESGTFRVPYNDLVHFEYFDSLDEWRLAVALEDNIFQTYRHISGVKDARYGYQFDYQNRKEWIAESYINLPAGDAVIYRPWVFHSFEGKHIHCYKVLVNQ